ncbi:hypothetical protein [Paenibacillus azoreducens]|uniref:DUF1433 domain-containing protein n=1 Tax=Paenibacillus azoreducens TaxID=116718 RepID=A0A919YD53_9BACL|nr:hypothetical protein [Paenibacillus azoreducens]GIO48511.1 hypothetical protein J34TS1_32760 [Paenibacillus azoreducens]
MPHAEKKEMVETATRLGQEYIKKHYNADFVVKDYQFIDPYIDSTVYLHGYIKGYEDIDISVAYNYKRKEINDVSGPDWFIDSRKP